MVNRILFDGISTQGSSRGKYHGGGEYAKYILREAIKRKECFDVVFNPSLFMDPQIEKELSDAKCVQIINVNNNEDLYALIREKQYEKFFSALPAKYTDYKEKTPLLGVIHGLRSIELPWDGFRYKYETRFRSRIVSYMVTKLPVLQKLLKNRHVMATRQLLTIPNASFITVSNHTKYSLLYYYPEIFSSKDIQVFYSPFHVDQITLHAPKDNYFFMVIGGRYEKNAYRAVRVFDTLFSKGLLPKMRVKITGCGKQPYFNEIKNKERFDLLPFVSSEELNALYANAFCFVYPSLNEGFGYPPLMAMSYGTPVVASSATSIPEVCGDGACYFSPTDTDDLSKRLLRVFHDHPYREELSQKGLDRVQHLQSLQERKKEELLNLIFTTENNAY